MTHLQFNPNLDQLVEIVMDSDLNLRDSANSGQPILRQLTYGYEIEITWNSFLIMGVQEKNHVND